MPRLRRSLLALAILALVTIAGSFLAGYLLMSHPGPAAPTLASRPASSLPTTPTTTPITPGLVITKALYGDLPDGTAADVTEKVVAAADHDSLSISATNDNFGDPVFGITKKLRVDYTFDGTPKSKTVGESETLTLSSTGD